jgi:hypothetical protein
VAFFIELSPSGQGSGGSKNISIHDIIFFYEEKRTENLFEHRIP